MMGSMARAEETPADAVRRHLLTPTAGIAVFGLFLVLLGRFAFTGVWAGMTGLWGISLVALAALIRTAILLVRIS